MRAPLALAIACVALLVAPVAATATPPGHNGSIAYQSYDPADEGGSHLTSIHTASADGTGSLLFVGGGTVAAWSPDGSLLAYTYTNREGTFGGEYDLRVRSADGKLDRPVLPGEALASAHGAWSPDGRSMVFTGIDDQGRGDVDLYVVDVSGIRDPNGFGSVRKLTDADGQEALPDWSPDGNWIAFTRGEELFIIPSGGGTEIRLAEGYSALRPSWRPDSQEIAFDGVGPLDSSSSPKELFAVAPSAGATPRRLTADDFVDAHPSWSPDGQSIIFSTTEDPAARADIAVLEVATLRRRRIVSTPHVETYPTWQSRPNPPASTPPAADPPPFPGPPPAGGRHAGLVAFSRETRGDAEIFTMNAGGGQVRQITDNAVRDRQPSWSPAVPGQPSRLAWTQFRGDGPHVMTMLANGSNVRDLGAGQAPDWSPDGRRIAFDSGPQPNRAPEIWSMAADGSDRRRISPGAPVSAFYVDPAWSPDATLIVASRYDHVRGEYGLCAFPAYAGVAEPSCSGSGPRRNPAWVGPAGRTPLQELLYEGATNFSSPSGPSGTDYGLWTTNLPDRSPTVAVGEWIVRNGTPSPAGDAVIAEEGGVDAGPRRLVRLDLEPRGDQIDADLTRLTLPSATGAEDTEADWQARRTPLPARSRGRFARNTGVQATVRRGRLVLANDNPFWVTAELHMRGRRGTGTSAARRLWKVQLKPATSRSRPSRKARRVRLRSGMKLIVRDLGGGRRTVKLPRAR